MMPKRNTTEADHAAMAAERKLDRDARILVNEVARAAFPGAGCTDGGCVYGHRGGMHTNGGCGCIKETDPIALRRHIRRLSGVAFALAREAVKRG